MKQYRSVRRPARGRSRGQSIVFIAIGGIALIGMVGLALDGGFEMAKYRDAQNAADAGALAAGRLIFVDSQGGTVPTTTQLTNTSNAEVQHNNATPGDANLSAGLSTSTLNNFVPDSGVGEKAHGALATVTAGVNAGLATVTASLTADESQATGLVRKVSSGGSTTSGQVDLANVNATVTTLGIPVSASGYLMCLQSTQSYPTTGVWSGSTACPNNSLSAVTSLLNTVGVSITASASTSLSPQSTSSYIAPVVPYLPETVASNALASVSTNTLGTLVSASAANVLSQVGPSASVVASQDFNLANLSTGLLSLAVSASLVTMHEELDYTPTGLVSAPTPKCDPGSITIGGNPYPILSSCHIQGLPPTLLGVTLKDVTSATTTGCPGLSCSEHGCFLELSVVASIADVCVGEFDLSAAGSKMSSSDAANDTALVNQITVTAHVDTPTFFMSILGWRRTQPTAKTSAAVLQVADESDAAFANAPYAMPDVATNMDCPCSSAPLTVGHDYYLFGSSMQSYSPVDKFAANWQGKVSASSGHSVGSILSSVSGTATGPGVYVNGGNYYVLPVIDPMSAVVEYYAVFKTVTGHSSWGQLTNTIAIQATPSTTWTPYAAGNAAAVTVKVTQ